MSSQLGSFEKVLRLGEGRRMKRLAEQAAYITSIEPEFQGLSDEELLAKTAEFRQRLENGEPLEELLFEAFAAVREARVRESDQRMFDVQLMGGIVLHEGDVAEMKTGEGKTFVASLALYLNGLEGKGVHLVTVNDYLAKRDAEWNRGVFERLGMHRTAERHGSASSRRCSGTASGSDSLRPSVTVGTSSSKKRKTNTSAADQQRVTSMIAISAFRGKSTTRSTSKSDFDLGIGIWDLGFEAYDLLQSHIRNPNSQINAAASSSPFPL